ncbi:hypothetical protein BC833DRAFT_598033, partial [Globomyces pollinis-pini]
MLPFKSLPAHPTSCPSCSYSKLIQYQCSSNGHSIDCSPLVRFFKSCPGYATIELKSIPTSN